ncbi:MAG: hypothetical protein Q6364_06875 [Candidatus Hermodarchaeota archaeon]|jgi:hypothetical protein|nr:hypothetical protein [Candidatus Hermodarchaeota archaeon]
MTVEPWQEPKPTIDHVRRLVQRIQSYARTSRIMGLISSALLVSLMIELGILMYMTYIPLILTGSGFPLPQWFYYLLMLTFVLSMVIYGIAGTVNARLNRYILEYRKIGVVVKLQCDECGRTSERIWEKDDFVFKKAGTCACGGSQYISQMYIMPLPLEKKDALS